MTHILLLLLSILFLLPSHSFASTDRMSLLFFRPATGTGDLLFTLSPVDLKDKQWRFSTHVGYLYRALETSRNEVRFNGIVDHLFVQHLGLAHAITPWWEIEMDIPLIWANKYATPTNTVNIPTSFKTDLGDLYFRHRFTILRKLEDGVGFGIIPFVTFPTGNEGHFVSDKYPTGGLLFALDARVAEKMTFQLNLGFEARQRFILFDLDLGSRLFFGGGASYQITDQFSGKLDFYSATPLNNLYKVTATSPTEILFGTNYNFPKSPFNLFLGGGIGLVTAVGSPKFRALLGVSYTKDQFPLSQLAAVSPGFANIPQTRDADLLEMETGIALYFSPSSSSLSPRELKTLKKVLKTIRKYPDIKYLVVAGHADSVGPFLDRMAISLKRANRIANYLVQNGIDRSMIKIEGYGDEKRLPGESRHNNRRVEIRAIN